MTRAMRGVERQVVEWSYTSGKQRDDPFNEVEVDVVLVHSDGESWRVPAYWAGGQEWRVRFAPPRIGSYEASAECSDRDDGTLNGMRCTLDVSPYTGNNPLLIHGELGVSESKRTLEHSDGTPFFWLGDTWWMGFCRRLSWPDDFQRLTADRVRKGFSVVQIVAGLYPDMPGFDERGMNEAGFPWADGYAHINPAYFDMADLRIQWLVRHGLVPCIVGCWGYYLPLLGITKMKQHWRYLIARWAGYPILWCLAGEAAMPYYLSEDKDGDRRAQIAGWTEMGRYLREVDPYSRLVTIHPTQIGRDQVEDDSVIDFDMLQTGHGGHGSVSNTVQTISTELDRVPEMPVIVGEVSYEGIIHGTGDEVQRLTFWASILSGSAGHTYGANGIWQVNTRARAYGPSPHGANWGTTPWDEASQLPGSYQLGLAKALLECYPWWQFEPHQEWVEPSGGPENVNAPFAAGIPGTVRIIYFYDPSFPWAATPLVVKGIESEVEYRAFFWDPRTGRDYDLGRVNPDPTGSWEIPVQPTLDDWVLILEAIV